MIVIYILFIFVYRVLNGYNLNMFSVQMYFKLGLRASNHFLDGWLILKHMNQTSWLAEYSEKSKKRVDRIQTGVPCVHWWRLFIINHDHTCGFYDWKIHIFAEVGCIGNSRIFENIAWLGTKESKVEYGASALFTVVTYCNVILH